MSVNKNVFLHGTFLNSGPINSPDLPQFEVISQYISSCKDNINDITVASNIHVLYTVLMQP